MTSKISFFKLARNEMHQLNWLMAIWGLLFGFLIPFRVLLVMAVQSAGGRTVSHAARMAQFARQVGLGRVENSIFILIAGVLCALAAFSYLHSAARLDMYHSLALRRQELFAAKYLGSTLTFVIVYLVCQCLAALIGVFYGVMSYRILGEMILASIRGILQFLCSYSASLLAILLTGKLVTTAFAIGVMGTYIPLVYLLQMAMQVLFLETSLGSEYMDLTESAVWQCSSPWAFCIIQLGGGKEVGLTGKIPTAGEICQILAVAAALTAICLLLYRIRKTEAAGRALAFRKPEGIVKLLLSVPTALAAALIASELFDSIIWETIFILLFGALACMIMEFIYCWDIRQVLRKKRHIVMTVVLTGALFFIFRFDLFGYNTYIPAKENVVAMAVRSPHFNISYPQVVGGYTYSPKNAYRLLDYLETEEFDTLYKLAENGVENVGSRNYEDVFVYVQMKYRTTEGKEIYRGYSVERELYLDAMDELIRNQEFREKYFPILGWTQEEIGAMTASASVYRIDEEQTDGQDYEQAGMETYIDIPSSRLADVVDAYRKDLETISWRDIWQTMSYLAFRSDHVSWHDDIYPLGEAFTETLRVLENVREVYGEPRQDG